MDEKIVTSSSDRRLDNFPHQFGVIVYELSVQIFTLPYVFYSSIKLPSIIRCHISCMLLREIAVKKFSTFPQLGGDTFWLEIHVFWCFLRRSRVSFSQVKLLLCPRHPPSTNVETYVISFMKLARMMIISHNYYKYYTYLI